MLQFLNSLTCCLLDNGTNPEQVIFFDETSLFLRYQVSYALDNQIHLVDVGNTRQIIEAYLSDYEPVRYVDVDNYGKGSTVILNFYHENLGQLYIYLHPISSLPTSYTNLNGVNFSDIDFEIMRACLNVYDGNPADMERLVDIIHDFSDNVNDAVLTILNFLMNERKYLWADLSQAHEVKLRKIVSYFNLPKPKWLYDLSGYM